MKTEKKCKKCDEIKIMDDFPVCDNSYDGRRNTCRDCRSAQKKVLYYKNHEHSLKLSAISRAKKPTKSREYRARLKLEVMTYYSKGTPKCKRCGYEDLRALCIDHIDGNGAEHRRTLTGNDLSKKPRDGGGNATYRFIKRNDYPDGFQVLCFNCNQIKECEQRDTRATK